MRAMFFLCLSEQRLTYILEESGGKLKLNHLTHYYLQSLIYYGYKIKRQMISLFLEIVWQGDNFLEKFIFFIQKNWGFFGVFVD